jgi:hypothetical protein
LIPSAGLRETENLGDGPTGEADRRAQVVVVGSSKSGCAAEGGKLRGIYALVVLLSETPAGGAVASVSRGIQFRHQAAKIQYAPAASLQAGTPMARLACLTTLTVLLVAAPAFGQAPPDAKAPSSDDYVLVDATNLTDAVLKPEFKWPQGTIIDSQTSSFPKSSCPPPFGPASSGEKDKVLEAFRPPCVVDMKLRVPRSRLDEVNALIERVQLRVRFGRSTKF